MDVRASVRLPAVDLTIINTPVWLGRVRAAFTSLQASDAFATRALIEGRQERGIDKKIDPAILLCS